MSNTFESFFAIIIGHYVHKFFEFEHKEEYGLSAQG